VRVIDELISYLWRNQKLNNEDIYWLSNNDYCDVSEFYDSGYDEYWERDHAASDNEEDVDVEIDEFEKRKPRPKSGIPTGQNNLIDDLVASLAAQREDASRALQAFGRFSSSDGAPETIGEIANRLARADTEAVIDAVSQVLYSSEEGLSVITRIITCNYIHVNMEGRAGPACRAYRKIIAARDIGAVGKYSWILKEPEIAVAYAVACAQARLARALGHLMATGDKAVARAIMPFDADAFWFLSLLLTATCAAGERVGCPPGIIAPRAHPLPCFDDLYHLVDLALGVVEGDGKATILEDASHPVAAFFLSRVQGTRPVRGQEAISALRARQRDTIRGLSALDIWDKAYRPPEVFDDWKSKGGNHE
jgi:hypothetical protein|tara:strand:+ start:1655 stop:2749 length:1095 start_codon:yes stop_codon:yes gene_type:complete